MIKFLDWLLLVLTTSLLFFFNQKYFLVIIISIITCLLIKISFHKNQPLLRKIIIFTTIPILIILFIIDNHLLVLRLSCVLIILYTILLIFNFSTNTYYKTGIFYKLSKISLKFLMLISITISLILVFFTIFPRYISHIGPTILKGNTDGVREAYVSKKDFLIYKNIVYPSPYENSRLDVYQTKKPKGTLFFIHGGGYVVYDKSHRTDYLMRFVEEGYNVVNINYSLFPNNAYPDTTKQVVNAYSFIINNASYFNIDKSKIFLSGDSSGGQLAGQLTLLLTNDEYRKNTNIQIPDETLQVKPLAFMGIATMFDPTTANSTDLPPINWLFDTALRDYFDTNDLKTSSKAKEASILKNVNKNFPATFISDGNLASFDYQAKEFHNKLISQNIDSTLYLIETDKILPHGFELDVDSPYSYNVFEKQIDFMNKQINKT